MAPILNKVLPALLTSGFLLIGEKKFWKTALASILAMAYSGWHIKRDDKDTKAWVPPDSRSGSAECYL
eukprot:2294964-Amphidinium_carterae.2